MTKYPVLRIENNTPNLLDPNVIGYTDWGDDPEKQTQAIGQVVGQTMLWAERQGWLEGRAAAEDDEPVLTSRGLPANQS